MKKLFAIFIALMVLASGTQVSIGRHYCGGELAATKLSVTGQLATCGMEENEQTCSNLPAVDKNCCNDQLTYFGFDNKYIPEYFKLSLPSGGTDIPSHLLFNIAINYSYSNSFHSSVLPPGDKLKSGFSLSEICVFRI